MGGLSLSAHLKKVPRLWCPVAAFTTSSVTLTPDQNHYLKKVLRLRPGAEVVVLNGQGGLWLAYWQEPNALMQEVLKFPSTENPYPVWLGSGVLKGDAQDWLIQKATELGLHTLQPLTTTYTQLIPSLAKQHRWQLIAQEACEQCERLYLPTIEPLASFSQVVCPYPLQCIAVERSDAMPLLEFLGQHPPKAIGLWIGPEGGWSPSELERDLVPVSLGPRILRAETAVCTALSIVNAWLGTSQVLP